MSWARLPMFQTEDDVHPVPDGWTVHQIESLFEKLPIGKRFEQKSVSERGLVPVIDQSADGVVGYHNEEPGITASINEPVVTFANHTCEMRWMTTPFSVIQNVFPMVGVDGVCSTRFFYYLTKGRVHIEEYKGHYPDFRRLWVAVPPLNEQRAIASILGSLDDKIELNRRMNRTLEQMAAAMFKAWFVDFEPVRAKASGAASFHGMPQPVFDALPATFADSELGPIPEGWEVRTFGDVLELPYGKALKADIRRPGKVPVYGSNGPVGLHDESLVKGPGIVVGRKGNPGTVEWCETDFFPIDTTFYVKTKSEAPSLRLLYYQLKSADLARLGADSAVPGVNRNAVYADPCIEPPPEFVGWFDDAVAPLWALMLSNSDESQSLAQTRDALLPKLLSGEVRVRAMEGVA